MNEAAEGAEVGAEGSVEGEVDGELEGNEDDAIVVDDVEGNAALQPATRPSARSPAPMRFTHPNLDRLPKDSSGYIDCPRLRGQLVDPETHGKPAR